MYAMCSLKVPITIFVHFENSGRKFLWADKEDKIQGKCLASWEMICGPNEQGGLGVLNLRTHNNALVMKKFHKFYNHKDIPWVNLVWHAYCSNGKIPIPPATRDLSDGETTSQLLTHIDNMLQYPSSMEKLASYRDTNGMEQLKKMSIHTCSPLLKMKQFPLKRAWTTETEIDNLYDNFHLPLLQSILLNNDCDKWSLGWGEYFSTKNVQIADWGAHHS
jgi:hypothetical protein